MNKQEISELVNAAMNLDNEIAKKKDELKSMKAMLAWEATLRYEDGEAQPGTSVTFEGIAGEVARVNFPSPALKSSIPYQGKLMEKITRLCDVQPGCFKELFIPVESVIPVEGFRDVARKELSPAGARKLIELCETKSAPRVSFETKDQSDPVLVG